MTNEVPDEAVLRQQVDRRQLQEIISGLGEGILLIDRAEGIVWANDKALSLHGVTELAELGTTAADYRARFQLKYRNNHVLTESQYPIDRLLAGAVFRDVIVDVTKVAKKGGRSEEDSEDDSWHCIQQLRGLILTDAKEAPESYVLIIEDMTERFTAEERFERAFGANPAPAIICRLSDLRYVKVNQGFLEMTGYAREDVIGRSTYEVDVLEGAATRDTAIAALGEGRTIPQTEATIRLPDGTSKFVIVAGQPIEVGEEACMLFTFMDLEPRRKAEDALRQSEERFARSFRLTPIPTVLATREGLRLLDANDAFFSVLGFTEEEVIGRMGRELPIWTVDASRRQLEREIEKSGSFRNVEIQIRTKHQEILDCLVSAETVSIHGEDCVLIVIQDITERKRTEVELIAAIETVMKDTSWFSRTVIEKLANLRHPGRASVEGAELSALTPRELEVLGLMCQGLSDGEIVKKLKLTRNTVRNHVARIYTKADVHSRAAAVVWARERGFIGTTTKVTTRSK
ncbi:MULTISPECIES: helix-turn-helix transcriptional regulator [unclassified Beijerinckia]|uniref:helix-turn-helix transcriptional regulator n=1 Tax=unclassified Beijerinckia TaxID=2638183 RepID=UPI00089B4CFB|nr:MULTISPECIES: helix-turn-helix transcriptional regulator [unclassified Beijerinckia]MDH7795366.1 PAS domain S-box-containing protein [Beijerinckia sp. GAS462]SEB98477.1 transcriptional regulator, LuxR family [Beijerinckia sp. 28-YEA-48]